VKKGKMGIRVGCVYIEDTNMTKKYWVVCNECGYAKEVYSEAEIEDNDFCPLCKGRMILDLNQGKRLDNDHKAHDEVPGDNFPKVPNDFIPGTYTSMAEQNIINSRNMIGDSATWQTIEGIKNFKIRLQYRGIFIKVGGKIPENNEELK
jgi:hypothetical protein